MVEPLGVICCLSGEALTASADDLSVISRHERQLHSVTGHRTSDTA